MPLSIFSSTFQDTFHFQGLFKTVLYIQVLNPVEHLIHVKPITLRDSDFPSAQSE